MDTIQIFKKTLGLVWRYRALWLFGCLFALTVNNALWLGFTRDDEQVVVENKIILSDSSTINFPGEGVTIDFRTTGAPVVKIEGLEPGWYRDLAEDSSLSDVRALLISIGVFMLIGTLLTILIRYTSKAALIRMVDEYERSEKMVSIRRGFRLGWSRIGWKLFLIDLSIILPVILVFGLLFALATSPLLLFGLDSITESAVSVIGIILFVTAGLLVFITLVTAVAVLLSIVRPVMHQACAVDGSGVMASIRQGFNLLKTRFIRVLSTWLVWFAVRLFWTIAIIPMIVILFPVILLTILVGILIGALITLPVAGIASLYVSTLFAWVTGVIFAVPLFFIVAFSPIFFLSGLVEGFKSSFWTLSYREFRPLPGTAPQSAGEPEQAGLEAELVK